MLLAQVKCQMSSNGLLVPSPQFDPGPEMWPGKPGEDRTMESSGGQSVLSTLVSRGRVSLQHKKLVSFIAALQ